MTRTSHRRTAPPAHSLLALGALGLVLASCSSGGADPADGGTTTLTFVGSDPAEAFAPLIEAFEAENPGITVEYQNVPFDQYNNTIQQRVGGGDEGIDVLHVDAGAVGSLASRGWLVDLDEFRDQADEVSLPAAVEGNVYEDTLWALPMWTSSQYLYANLGLLEAAGVPAPSTDPAQRLTWEQVTEQARAAQAAGAQHGLLFDQTDRYYQLQVLPESLGGGSGATGDDLLTADVTNDGWQRSMEWYASIFETGVSPRGIATDQMIPLFSSGQAAFLVGGPWVAGILAEEGSEVEYAVAPHPYFDGGSPAMPTGSWSLGVSAASDAPEEAKRFVEFVSLTEEGNTAAIDQILIPPTNEAAFADYIPRLDQTTPPATTGMGELTLSELQEAAVNRPNSVGFTQMQDILGRAFADIRNGQDVAETLENAETELQSSWDRLR